MREKKTKAIRAKKLNEIRNKEMKKKKETSKRFVFEKQNSQIDLRINR